jgi:zinc transport system substrate-binding protein
MTMILVNLVRSFVAAALAVLPLSGCTTGGSDSGRPLVVTSVYPLQFLAERIGGDHVDVTNLTRPGQEPHDLELTLDQTARLADAELVLYDAGFQPAVDAAAKNDAEGTVVDALQVLRERPPAIPGTKRFGVVEGDPHFWLDPRSFATVAAEVGDRLADIDPDHARSYERNAGRLHADLVRLDGQFADGLQHCGVRTVVVSHEAFDYLGYRYNLEFESIAGLSPESEPSPQHIAALHDLIEADGITTVFTESLASPAMAQTLSSDLGLVTAVLDPIEGLTDQTAHEDYLSLMRKNLAALRKANGC